MTSKLIHKALFTILLISLAYSLTFAQQKNNSKTTEERIIYASDLLEASKKNNDPEGLAEAYYLFGKIEHGLGNIEKSLDYFLKSLVIVEDRNMPYQTGRLYHQMAGIAHESGQTDEYKRIKEVSKNIFLKGNSIRGLKQFFPELVNNYAETDIVTKAALLYNKASELIPTNPDSSLILFNDALELLNGYDDEFFSLSLIQAGKANLLSSLGKFKEAEILLNDMNERLKTGLSKNSHFKARLYNAWYTYFNDKKDYKKALEYLLLRIEMDKIIYQADRDGALSKLKIQYNTEKNELLLKENSLKIKTQNRIILIVLIGLLLSIGLAFLFYYLYHSRAQTLRTNNILIREQNHRVKNNLQLISSLINLQKENIYDSKSKRALEDTQFRLESIAILHRQLYDGKNAGSVNIADFLGNVLKYALDSFDLTTKLKITQNIQEIELEPDKASSLGLILNELITNSCKYAFPFTEEPELNFEVKLLDESLIYFKYADNGPGVVNKETFQNGFGMDLIKMQTAQLKGNLEIDIFEKLELTMTFNRN